MVLCAYFLDFKVKRYKHIRNEITESGAGFSQTNLILAAKEIGEPEFILKVDIEGGEYLIIDQICFLSTRIPLLIIEFHDTGSRRTEFEDAIAKLSKEYLICHSHANNFEPIGPDGIPTAIELTLGRRNFFHIHQEINSLPIPKLDAPSARNRKDHTIAFEKL
jgi:hypothetical protein